MALIVSLWDGVRGRDGVKPGQERQQQKRQQKTFIANFCDDFKQRNHKGRLEDLRRQNDEKMWHGTVHSQSYATFFRYSAVVSLPAILLRKFPMIGTRKRQTDTPANKINS